jgi:hypothetical protein
VASPERWVRYDGVPEDVELSLLVGISLVAVTLTFRWIVATARIVADGYGLLRHWLASLAPVVAGGSPNHLATTYPSNINENKQFRSTKLIVRCV